MLKRFYEQSMLFSVSDIHSSKSLTRTSQKADQLVFQVIILSVQPAPILTLRIRVLFQL